MAVALAMVMGAGVPGPASAHQVNGTTEIGASANPVMLGPGIDVVITTATRAVHAGSPAGLVDQGRVTLQLAVDGTGAPTAAASVVTWRAINAPGVRPDEGVTEVSLDLDALGFGPGTTGALRALYRTAGGRHAVRTHISPPLDIAASDPAAAVARLEVGPRTVLLTGLDDTRRLSLGAFAADGTPVVPEVRWSSTRPGTVAVTGEGVLEPIALGSAQITASVGDVTSEPVLVVVALPAPGTVVVTDEQIIGEPYAVDPSVAGHADISHAAVLEGVAIGVGDLVMGNGEKPLAGRVELVFDLGGNRVEVGVVEVPLGELFDALEIDELIELDDSDVTIRPDLAADYEVEREGDRYTFTPRAGAAAGTMTFASLQPAANGAPSLAAAEASPGPPPFASCEADADVPGEPSDILKLAEPPSFSIELNPSLDLQIADGSLRRVTVGAEPTAIGSMALQTIVEFEGEISCRAELMRYTIPVGGPLGIFLGGQIPVGVGIELDGKLTAFDQPWQYRVEVGSRLELGLDCPTPACSFVRSMDPPVATTTVGPSVPTLAGSSLELAMSAFAWAELRFGSPWVQALSFAAFEARVGGVIHASFAPRALQVLPDAEGSMYGIKATALAKVGSGITDLLEKLEVELGDSGSLEAEYPLDRSPTGSVTAERASYAAGDTVRVRVTLSPDDATFLGVENIERLTLVHAVGGSLTDLVTVDGLAGSVEYDLSVVATAPMHAADLYVFVDTVVPLDLVSLLVGQSSAVEVSVSPTSVALAPLGAQQFTATVTGTEDQAVTWSADCGSIGSDGWYVAPAAGSCTVTAASAAFPGVTGSSTVTVDAGLPMEVHGEVFACDRVPNAPENLVCDERVAPPNVPAWSEVADIGESTADAAYSITLSDGLPRMIAARATAEARLGQRNASNGVTWAGARFDAEWEWTGADTPFSLSALFSRVDSPDGTGHCEVVLDGPDDDYRYSCSDPTNETFTATGMMTAGSWTLHVRTYSTTPGWCAQWTDPEVVPTACFYFDSTPSRSSYDLTLSIGAGG